MFQVLATVLSLVFDHLIFLKNMNIYVGNLNWNMSSEDLQNLFTPFGEVTSAKIVTDKFNNDRSKGFGFVEMADDEAARARLARHGVADPLCGAGAAEAGASDFACTF